MIYLADMPRRNQRSSRKRFFEEHYFEDEHEKTTDDNANIIGNKSLSIVVLYKFKSIVKLILS